jgi:hypothetical protein
MNASKILPCLIVAFATSALSVKAQAPAAPVKPGSPPAKLTARDIRVHDFAQEHKETKFKPGTRELPDELTVTRSDRIRIYGKRRIDGAPNVRGRGTGHLGKLVLLPPGDRKGTLSLKRDFGTTFYFAVLELPDDALNSHPIKLKEGKSYEWSVKSENGRTILRVVDGNGVEIGSNAAETDKVLGVGFAATVRTQGNEVDLTMTYDK